MNARFSRRHMTREERQDRAMIGGKARLPRTLKQIQASARIEKFGNILLWVFTCLCVATMLWMLWNDYQNHAWFSLVLWSSLFLYYFLMWIWRCWRARLLSNDGANAPPTQS